MTGQINIFDYLEEQTHCKPCECGNTHLAIRYSGCGIPQSISPVTYEKYLYCVFCPECYRVATASLGWRSNKTSIDDAINDWNKNEHKISDSQFVGGRYGLKWYAEHMAETINRFDEARKVVNAY